MQDKGAKRQGESGEAGRSGAPKPILRFIRSLRRARSTEPPLTHIDVEHEGVSHRILVRRVATARRFILRVRVARGDVVLTMPAGGSAKAARDFAGRHAGWVATRMRHVLQPVAFVPGAAIPYRGVPHRLVRHPGLRRRVWIDTSGAELLLCVAGPESGFAEAVLRFLREEAKAALTAAVQRHAAAVRRRVAGLALRDTKSRWGSCSAHGRLNFSWRLILAPPVVLDYLAAHEVAHLVHMNHSDAFWALTCRLAPQTDEAERWLKAHGAGLHRYGVATEPADRSAQR